MKTLARHKDQAEILERLRRVSPQSVARWGRMSAHQMICHLYDAVRMAMGEQPVTPATGVLQRTLVKWIALYVPLPWPGGRIRTSPEIQQPIGGDGGDGRDGGGTAPTDFASDVARLLELLDRVTATPRTFEWAPHPIFGMMSEAAWLRWSYLHLDHHLRQFGA